MGFGDVDSGTVLGWLMQVQQDFITKQDYFTGLPISISSVIGAIQNFYLPSWINYSNIIFHLQ